ncbi:Nucleotide-binding protein 2 [Chytridiales sp. JEL 0842]|nr:Nucleotide-binding protein 2 [Chytridiales sp. JEL 0842]
MASNEQRAFGFGFGGGSLALSGCFADDDEEAVKSTSVMDDSEKSVFGTLPPLPAAGDSAAPPKPSSAPLKSALKHSTTTHSKRSSAGVQLPSDSLNIDDRKTYGGVSGSVALSAMLDNLELKASNSNSEEEVEVEKSKVYGEQCGSLILSGMLGAETPVASTKEGEKDVKQVKGGQGGSLALSNMFMSYDLSGNSTATLGTANTSEAPSSSEVNGLSVNAASLFASSGESARPVSELMSQIALEHDWTPEELANDLSILKNNRIKTTKDLLKLSEKGWDGLEGLLPFTKDLLKEASGTKHIILVLSGKGGVGKSTVSAELTLTLAHLNKKTGVLDVDLTGPSMPRMLGVEDRQGKDEPVVWRGPKKNAMIKQFLEDVAWGEMDYLIIDTPPGTGDEHISLAEHLKQYKPDGAVIVTTPQDVSLADVRKELSFCKKVGIPIIGIVENMSGYVCPNCSECTNIFSKGGGEALAKEYNVPFLGCIPIDPSLVTLIESTEGGFVKSFTQSGLFETFKGIAEKVIESCEGGKE